MSASQRKNSELDNIREEIVLKDNENGSLIEENKDSKPVQRVNSRVQQIKNAFSFPSTSDIIRNDSCKSVPRRDAAK